MNSQEQPDEDGELSRSTVFDVLSSRRRRWVLQLLDEAGGRLDMSTLTERVAALEMDLPVEEVPSQARKRAYVSLYQTHIPRLEDAGLVEYDADEGTIIRTERARAIDPYLTENHPDRRWPLYYLFIALLGAGSLAAALVDTAPAPSVVLVVLVVLLLVTSAVHAYSAGQTTLHERIKTD